ncbi:Pkinase-domain-containing protein [Melanogaster broomeanus]|nr:Pkinase-domain-containing protein [Melanogaster broomeanus]
MAQLTVHQLFRRLETVGKGAYGSVHKGVHIPTGNIVALKIINLDTADDDVEAIQREVALLTQLRDAPNVTKYYGCYLDGPRVWIAMEFAQGGSVRTLMQTSKDGVLEERFIVVVTREVLIGLSYLHKSAIIHRDIKAANILITATGKVMICDFGVSALSATTTSKRNTLMGTPNWMAPEVAQLTPVYDSKADIWSLGIMVYEMAKGAPPHSDLRDAIKVMQLISKVKPPRLGEGEGSKDMRDFVSHCLRESPNDRFSADELAKTKWIKSVSKVNVSVLTELILRYDAWIQSGGSRASLAERLDWEGEEKKDLQRIVEEDDDLWEFDTLRRGSLKAALNEDHEIHPSSTFDTPSVAATVRPIPSRLPTSLRGLFDVDAGLHDTLKAPLFPPSSLSNSLTAPPAVPQLSSSPARERAGVKRAGLTEGVDDAQLAKYNEFAFPPRVSSRAKSKLSTAVPPHSRDEGQAADTDTADRQSIDFDSTYEHVTGDPEIPPNSTSHADTSLTSMPATNFVSLPEAALGKSTLGRNRSQPNFVVPVGPGASLMSRARGTVSPSEFQFPASTALPSSGPSLASAYSPTSHSRLSPTHVSASSASSFSATPVNRARSVNAADADPSPPVESPPSEALVTRKPSLNRQASVAVMESTPASPLMPPVRPFAVRERSGSSSSKGSDGSNSAKSPILPGLKDAVKVSTLTSEHQMGMTDLLPPSPSSLIPGSRSLVHSSSMFGSNPLGSLSDANSSTVSLPIPRNASPPRLDRRGKPGFTQFSHATSLSLTISQEATNSHLARTVEDLSRWFSVIEVGFANMLEQPGDDAIAEEQETPRDDGSFTATSDGESSVHVPPRRALTTDV